MTSLAQPMLADPVLAFGDFRLDSIGRRLIHGGQVILLPERLFGVLSLLVRANGQIVEKRTFATDVWPDVTMTDGNLAQHIYLLRQILKETARDRSYIAAASGRGYRVTVPVFAANVSAIDAEHTPAIHTLWNSPLGHQWRTRWNRSVFSAGGVGSLPTANLT
ncbi:MAG: winged helix-turn-helix domain-containing protein [Candidatus Eremiobacteraeota bacterium]|nr:winged helix-turn-helix domain-containing protein [Candidatus Eremiobacteraeota bacterium]